MAVQAVTRQVMWHGLVLADHEGYDAARDDAGCPDVFGVEESRRPLFNRRALNPRATRSGNHVEPGPEPHGEPDRVSPPPARSGPVPTQDVSGAPGSRRDAA